MPRLTYLQISAHLNAMGHEISPGQVSRWLTRQRNDLERMETARERALTLQKYLVPDGANIEQAAVTLTGALCLEALADAQVQQVGSIADLAKIAHAMGSLQASAVARERWEQDKGKRIEEAVKRLKATVTALLEGQPDLTEKLLEVIDTAKDEIMEKPA